MKDAQVIKAGQEMIDTIALHHAMDVPMIFWGSHGIGKSEIIKSAAATLGIEAIVVDLSTKERVDLQGLPYLKDGRSSYAPPAFLPTEGKGLLIFEELNRVDHDVQSVCFELLTARRVGEYDLPPGWLPCAAANPSDDGYLVNDIDPALLSRWAKYHVKPDVDSWLAWALENGIHEDVYDFVQDTPGIFDNPDSNPRAWTYVSRAVEKLSEHGKNGSNRLLKNASVALLGPVFGTAFSKYCLGSARPLVPKNICTDYPAYRARLRRWVKDGELDKVKASMSKLCGFLQPASVYKDVMGEQERRENVVLFASDLPGDLRYEFIAWCKDRRFERLASLIRKKVQID